MYLVFISYYFFAKRNVQPYRVLSKQIILEREDHEEWKHFSELYLREFRSQLYGNRSQGPTLNMVSDDPREIKVSFFGGFFFVFFFF